jgi:alpha-beta hydrolase superfamily lysophospholipase
VLAIGCSTGCTLLTLALGQGAAPAGVVMISPNFALASRFGQAMLDLPLARLWAPLIAGRQISYPVKSPGHAAGWTTSYPVQALYPMAAAVRACRSLPLERLRTPAMFAFAQADRVVSPPATHKVMARWGGPVTHHSLTPGPEDDPYAHVMAGDVFSPGQTVPLAGAIAAWARAL